MRIARRIALGLGGLLLVVAGGLACWEPLFVDVPQAPDPVAHDVRIVRDTYGVPHIFGKTDADTAYGLAYAHAEDDFPTIQQVLAMSRHRAAALMGADAARIDYVSYLLDVQGTVDRHYDSLPLDVRRLLDAAAAGLNHYAELHPDEVELDRLFPATGRDLAFGFVLRSPFFFGLDRVLAALIEGRPTPREGGSSPERWAMTPIGPAPWLDGSNAFAIAPARAPDRTTRLLSNSHQPLRGQVAWYEAVVHSEEGWDFAGATFPGAPYPLMGHNKHLGWTNTVNRPDLVDVYRLQLDDTGANYRLDGAWKTLERRTVWLHVKFGPFVIPVPKSVWRSAHGPVIENSAGAFAFRYAGIDDIRTVEQYYRLNKAQNFEQWQRAMAMQAVPATNFVYADAAGNIGLFYNAKFPKRAPGHDWRTVLPGDDSELIWTRPVDWSEVPRNVNPASGYIMNSNNTPFVAAGPGNEIPRESVSPLLGVELDMTNRAYRAIEQLEQEQTIGAEELLRIKFDTAYSKQSYAAQWMDALLAVDAGSSTRLKHAQELLAQWDWNLDGKGKGDALALLLLRPAMTASYRRQPEPDAAEELSAAAEHLSLHFGSLDPPLGDLMRLRLGELDLPHAGGGSDTLRAITFWDVDEKTGRLAVNHGDSFIMLVEWAPDGSVSSRSVQPFGAATSRPQSKHYTDQSRLYLDRKFKPVFFDPETLAANTEREYRP